MFKSFVSRCLALVLVYFLSVAMLPSVGMAGSRTNKIKSVSNANETILTETTIGEFHRTQNKVLNPRLIEVANSATLVALWQEQKSDGQIVPYYAISLDRQKMARVTETSYDVLLRYKQFEPLKTQPVVPEFLSSDKVNGDENIYIVQYVTQPLEDYRKEVREAGGTIYNYLANHAELVKMNDNARQKVEALPFVRWVGDYHPAYRLESYLLNGLNDMSNMATMRYNIMVFERGLGQQNKVADYIRTLGGKVDLTIPEGFRMEATLTPAQLLETVKRNEVLFIDRWSPPETDMDVVRTIGGANFIETTLGYTGQGVSGEVMDNGMLATHNDFQGAPATLFHGTQGSTQSHGTSTFGIVFGNGTANLAGRGMLPSAQKIFANYSFLTNRYTHTEELKQAPYKAVFQSNSWGNTQTTAYTTISAEMDDILFQKDFTLLNSQSNTGNQNSRPQAWAKNVVSIGGVRHFNTAATTDDCWCTGASIGPAADGRIKPDLAHFYDSVLAPTSTSNTAYTQFSGTSAATPITAGHFGIFFQMWHNGLFGNTPGATVFDSRPHMTTTKAIMINTAAQWDNTAGVNVDLTRVRQGWGRPDLQNLYNLRNKMFIVDERDLLTNLATKIYTVTFPAGSTTPLKATMTYADPMGTVSSTRHRINDLTLKVTSPSNVVYYGNNGLTASGQWSTPGGTANIIDTVENVYIQNPESGNWTVEVIASEVIQDANPGTPAIDADFALVVSGVNPQTARRTQFDFEGDGKADISIFRPSNGQWWIQQSSDNATKVFTFGTTTDRIVPADYDGDGKTDVAFFRPSTNEWFVLRSSNLTFYSAPFGAMNDIPAPGDFDGDSKADLAVYRQSAGTWFINRSTGGTSTVPFGISQDLPVVGDYDGDSKADIGVFRPTGGSGNAEWWILKSTGGVFATPFGSATDKPVQADYTGDRKADVAIFRPSTAEWFILRSEDLTFYAAPFGTNGDTPAPGDFDGDGKTDLAVFRSSNATWFILRSTQGQYIQNFGASGDLPTQASFIP
jgi:hypothetical protein